MFNLEKDKDLRNLKAIVVPASELYPPMLKAIKKISLIFFTPLLLTFCLEILGICIFNRRYSVEDFFVCIGAIAPTIFMIALVYNYYFVYLCYGPNIVDSEKYWLQFTTFVKKVIKIVCVINWAGFIIYLSFLIRGYIYKNVALDINWYAGLVVITGMIAILVIEIAVTMEISRLGINIVTNTAVNFLHQNDSGFDFLKRKDD